MIIPINDQILIKPKEVEEQTSSGIYIPNSASDGPVEGTVVAVGSNDSITVSSGDTVLYVHGSGTKTKHNNEEFLFLKEEQILAKVAEGE